MKKIGLVGGLGPASTIEYYNGLIELCRDEYGKDVYPEIVIDSVNMAQHTAAFDKGDYDEVARLLLKSLENLRAAGAELAAVTANTEHIVWDIIKDRLPLPAVSVITSVTEEIRRRRYKSIVVLGTKWTMESGLYENAILSEGVKCIIPDSGDREKIGNIIYPNLENGIVVAEDKKELLKIAEKYISDSGADAVLLGCTELPLMIKQGDLSVPGISSTEVHINRIYQKANQR